MGEPSLDFYDNRRDPGVNYNLKSYYGITYDENPQTAYKKYLGKFQTFEELGFNNKEEYLASKCKPQPVKPSVQAISR